MGGIYAEANLRGGGEYGEAWHQAGTLANKQNVFDDFIAAAEYLIHEHYTRTARLGIYGRSNGGLLVGAAHDAAPGAVRARRCPRSGVLDMLRYHTASANARQWASDYGLAEDPEQFRALYAYSPVQNVRQGTCYPPTLITTADHDDRVVPWHSYKFAAALQAAQSCANPDPDPRRDPRRARRGQAGVDADRGVRRPVGVPGEVAVAGQPAHGVIAAPGDAIASRRARSGAVRLS